MGMPRTINRRLGSGDLGVIITNRDRSDPLDACLASIAAQTAPPAWVVLADLSSSERHRVALAGLAGRYQISYLRIEHDGRWNKSLAFNTALRQMPAARCVVQLDADAILHPQLLSTTAALLGTVDAFCCAPRLAPPQFSAWTTPGDIAQYQRMLTQCGPVSPWAIGVFMAVPRSWLMRERGMDEAYTGWGHEDTELWLRAGRSLRCRKDVTGSMVIHQSHPRQPDAAAGAQNRGMLIRRITDPSYPVNQSGWGLGRITDLVLRAGIRAPEVTPGLPIVAPQAVVEAR
jgi:GT2 family glycosyltransferase